MSGYNKLILRVLAKYSGRLESVNPALRFYKDITATDPNETFDNM